MKKIVLTLALAAFAFAANAQIVVSANIGGNMTSGTLNTKTVVSIAENSSTESTQDILSTTNIDLGAKIGYKFGKCQAGIAGSFNMYSFENQDLDATIIPIMNQTVPHISTTGTMSTKGSTITVAPYFRYDIIQSGDIALFAELQLFYSMAGPQEITCHVENKSNMEGFIFEEIRDSTFSRPYNMTSMGAKVTPGLSWQLSKNCAFDLYFDFLSLAYSKVTTTIMNNDYSFVFDGAGNYKYAVTSSEVTTETSGFDCAVTGTPLLTEVGSRNWVRVGFNLTF
ncbi:MAG: hypothetical protein MJZ67_08600 [Bacteroidales bacterium]|nr:hypothetical protein [Bacteroidales bacterium]